MTEAEKDATRLRWLAETMQLTHDSDANGSLCNWNGRLLLMVFDRFHKWRKLPPNDALDAMRKAIDTQVVYEAAEVSSENCSTEEKR
jgi:hypothetical protein